ncbi:MAG: zonular occludens toxin domain-containing protein [bacterium]|nr:zonular occludens toxin domain-containing protein [bacterium]
MSYLSFIKKEFKPNFKVVIDDLRRSRDKDFFQPTGTTVYVGWQGSGKTLSAVKHVDDIMRRYPKAKLVTNLRFNHDLIDYANRIHVFQTADELAELLVGVNNGTYGVVYLIDEIHTYFNALDSKNIPPYIFTEISQQRKQRKCIVGTSQLWDRMAKPFREQAMFEIQCSTIMNVFTIQRVVDAHSLKMDRETGRSVGKLIRRGWFFHNRRIRDLYDTYQKVISSQAQLDFETSNPVIIGNVKKIKRR